MFLLSFLGVGCRDFICCVFLNFVVRVMRFMNCVCSGIGVLFSDLCNVLVNVDKFVI